MKVALVIFFVLLVGIAGLGFYQGWFRVSAEGTDPQPSATISVDKEKFSEDGASVREKVFGSGEAEETDTPAEEVEP